MKQYDKNIKDALLSKMERIDKPSFTDNIVNRHLSRKEDKTKYVQFDFVSLIAGLVSVIVSLGIGILITAENIKGLTYDYLIILISVTVIYLIYRLLSEITTPNMR